MMYTVEMGSSGMIYIYTYIQSFMKISTGIESTLRFCLRNLKVCNAGITDGRNLWCMLLKWAEVAWYMYQIDDNWFRHLSNITVITVTIWEAVKLALLVDGLYELCRWDGFMRHDIKTKFYDDWYRRSSNIKVLPQKSEGLYCWYYWLEGFINYTVDMGSDALIYIPNFI
jgi:hypothetical protein